jgi:hypothetical protein
VLVGKRVVIAKWVSYGKHYHCGIIRHQPIFTLTPIIKLQSIILWFCFFCYINDYNKFSSGIMDLKAIGWSVILKTQLSKLSTCKMARIVLLYYLWGSFDGIFVKINNYDIRACLQFLGNSMACINMLQSMQFPFIN